MFKDSDKSMEETRKRALKLIENWMKKFDEQVPEEEQKSDQSDHHESDKDLPT